MGGGACVSCKKTLNYFSWAKNLKALRGIINLVNLGNEISLGIKLTEEKKEVSKIKTGLQRRRRGDMEGRRWLPVMQYNTELVSIGKNLNS